MGPFGDRKMLHIAELEGLPLSSTDSDCIENPRMQHRHVKKVAVVAMAFMALFATAFYSRGFGNISTIALHHGNIDQHDNIIQTEELDKQLDEFVGLAESDSIETAKCETLSKIKSLKKVRNNLGGIGPDEGEEGMIYSAFFSMEDEQGHEIGKNITVAIHATSPYEMDDNSFNGLYGKFLSILGKTHKNLSFNVSLYDEISNEPLVLPYFSITFFDLDMSPKKGSAEYIIARDFVHYYVANGTHVNISENEDGTTKFKATEIGSIEDNPKESEALEPEAKSKGVTLQYLNRASAEFTVGAEHHDLQTKDEAGARGFIFTLRPSILCAKTHVGADWVDPMDVSIPGVELPLMDGTLPVTGMKVPKITITEPENGTVVIESQGQTITINNVSGVVAVNGEILGNDKGNANPKSGTKVLLMVVALLAVVCPLGNLQ